MCCSDRAVRLTALFKVALMIFFGPPKLWRWLELRHDGPIETSALFQLVFRGFGGRLLPRRMVKDHGTILLSNIGPLPIQRRRIVVRPENIKQLVVIDLRWVEFHFHHFGVAGFVRANIFIGWIILRTARVPNRCRDHAVQFSECSLPHPRNSLRQRLPSPFSYWARWNDCARDATVSGGPVLLLDSCCAPHSHVLKSNNQPPQKRGNTLAHPLIE